MLKHSISVVLIMSLFGCSSEQPQSISKPQNESTKLDTTTPFADRTRFTLFERGLKAAGLVNVRDKDSTICKDLRYSTNINFIGEDLYGEFDQVYLQPLAVDMLVKAQQALRSKHTDFSLVVFDAVRPVSVQQRMWDRLDSIPPNRRADYVSNPARGSLHNFGLAVDVSVKNERGQLLDMGTGYDYFGDLAYPSKEAEMLAAGKLTQEQLENRKILRAAMQSAGWRQLPSEWWHYNAMSREEASTKYELVQ